MWFNVVGAILGFIGTVIFSAGLIKPKEQIIDETQAYWDSNPFTTKAGLSSQPYFIIAFILIITGFATTLGGMIGEIIAPGDILLAVLFCVSLSLLGYLATSLLYLVKIIKHTQARTAWLRGIFINTARSYRNKMRGIIGQPDEDSKFSKFKETYQKDLLEKYKRVPEPDNSSEYLLIGEIDSAGNAQQFVDSVDKYLQIRS